MARTEVTLQTLSIRKLINSWGSGSFLNMRDESNAANTWELSTQCVKAVILNHRHCHPLIIIRFYYCRKILQKVCGCGQKKRVEKRIINQIRTETAEYETRLVVSSMEC